MKVRRSQALRAARPQPLFDYKIDLKLKIRACKESGVELTKFEKKVLEGWSERSANLRTA